MVISEQVREQRLRQLRAVAVDEGRPLADRMIAEIERQHELQAMYDEELAREDDSDE